MKTIYIIRGVQGSGKSTLASMMQVGLQELGFTVESHCADDYFTDEDGNYNFDRENLSKAHYQCLSNAESSMMKGIAFVIIHNTFTRRSEIAPYLGLAVDHGYTSVEIVTKGRFKNVHGVPEEIVDRFRDRWED